MPGALDAATFNWANVTGNWSDSALWGGTAPTGTNLTDVLIFAGDVGTTAGSAPNYTATNDIAVTPFALSGLTLNATDAAALATDPAQIIAGGALLLSGSATNVTQNNAGGFTFETSIRLGADLALGGEGAGVVTFNRGISGFADLIKSGASTFRFGTLPTPPALTAPSANTWLGALRLSDGTFRFNNNADSGRTAMRANPVVFPASAAIQPLLTCTSEIRLGTIGGTVGKVESAVTGTNTDSQDIVVTALTGGSFAGTLRLGPPTGTGNDVGKVVVRGPGVQTLTGTLQIDKDVEIAGSLTLSDLATLGAQIKGAITLGGGTLRLDNTTSNNSNRLRDGSTTSTGLDTPGGGLVQLIGNTALTAEIISRVQLSAQTGTTTFKTKARAGELRFGLVHRAGAASATTLTMQTYERDATSEQPLGTVEFSATDGAGTPMSLGVAGSNPRVVIATLPIALSNSLLDNNTGTTGTGWAVVKTTGGLGFATHAGNGIAAVATTATWATNAAANVILTANQAIGATAFNLHTLRLAPTAAGQSLTIAAGGTLAVKGIALSGAFDSTISGAGALVGATPRYIHVEQAALTIATSIGNTAPLVKAGAGTLILSSAANTATTQIVAVNRGTLRTPLSALPGGELRLRGGVLEITGGGTFSRPLVDGAGISSAGTVNWNNVELAGAVPTPTKTGSDRGSGGFAALGADAIVDLGTAGATPILWEQRGFLQSGYALVLGSPAATAKITLLDDYNLSSGDLTINYNAREIRVDDNVASTADRAVLSGIVAGNLHNDLLKTGAGTLELSGANTLAGTIIAQAGTLVVSGSASSAIAVQVMNGATLAGAGSVTNILLESGGRLSPGDSTAAPLTATGLTWKAGGIARFDLGASTDRVALGSGALSKRGTGTFAFDFGGGGALGNVYTLATFGSTDFAASNFTATNLAGGVTGVFKIVGGTTLVFDTVVPPLELWRQSFFGPAATDTGTAANLADPEFDGLANLLEYALAGNPLTPAPTLWQTSTPGGRLAITFTRTLANNDITMIVQGTDSLTAGWSDLAQSVNGSAFTALVGGVTVTESGSGATRSVQVQDLYLTSDPAHPQRFLRVQVQH